MAVLRVKAPFERSVRLAAGLVLFAYVVCHFVSHAAGLFLLDGIEAIGHDIILAPWRTPVGLAILLAAILIHVALGLRGLYRRRHLRMPAIEAWQFGLGLAIPLMLAPHVVDARIGVLRYGLEDSYFRVLYLFWVTAPGVNLPRQFALLLAVWTHGCIGVHMWLRQRRWYPRRAPALAAFALLLPTLAILGVVNAGWDTVLRAAVEPGFADAHGPPAPNTPHALADAALALLVVRLQLAYLAILAGVFAARAIRTVRESRAPVRIVYRDGRSVTVPRGFSILEASRRAGIPHVSVCGGRGRCSTCRVRVWRGLEGLPPASPAESATLQRIGAAPDVRLACQLRPIADIGVTPLAKPGRSREGLGLGLEDGRELAVTALYLDLRESTRLAAGRLPFDALYILDRFIQATTAAIVSHRGHVASIAGDGIMSVFGLGGDAALGARDALRATGAAWRAIDQVSADLAHDLDAPLRFGIGVHSGPSVVGAIGPAERSALQFLGDTGNVAARLESLTKEMRCVAIVSAATLAAAGGPAPDWRRAEVAIRGRDQPIGAFLIDRIDQLAPDDHAVEPR
ncbi:MAG: adenylate/guanylate cyclase domain-containing protein [Roseiarcus sp.]